MASKRRILSALLASVAPDLRRLRCVDLTADGIGGALLPRRPLSPGEAADLVLADHGTIDAALSVVRADGLVLVYTRQEDDDPDLWGDDGPLEVRGTVGVDGGRFRLCVPAPRVRGDRPISLVVPTRDDLAALSRLVAVLAAESVRPAWELIVVDRGSEDGTAAFLRTIHGSFRSVHLHRDAPVDEAITTGLSVAKGDLAFICAPSWLPACGWRTAIQEAAASRPDARAWIGALVEGRTGRALPAAPGPLGTPTLVRLPIRREGPVVVEPRLRVFVGRLGRRPAAHDAAGRGFPELDHVSFTGLRAVPRPPQG
ncbi:MAG: glycosyltransferase family 2 protein [Deltaproteobacteria bacterium]|nr:MAG: glycosyltransferase family 2 protein [Deltaproteobacteria bacterium]